MSSRRKASTYYKKTKAKKVREPSPEPEYDTYEEDLLEEGESQYGDEFDSVIPTPSQYFDDYEASEDDDYEADGEEEYPQQPSAGKKRPSTNQSGGPPNKRRIAEKRKEASPESRWIVPHENTEKFQEADLAFDDDSLPTVNWWSADPPYPHTMKQLHALEQSLGVKQHAQMAQWNQKLGRALSAEPTEDMLSVNLTTGSIANTIIPGTPKNDAAARIRQRIVSVAQKQLRRRKVATLARLKKEKHQSNPLPPAVVNEAFPEPSNLVTPATPDLMEDASPEEKMERLEQLVSAAILGGEPFPEEGYQADVRVDNVSIEESDRILSVTPLDDRRVVFSRLYKKLKPIDFVLQIPLPAWTTRAQADRLISADKMRELNARHIGVKGDYRILVDMKNAPHDAAYHYATENQDAYIEQHTRQWFITVNFNKTVGSILKDHERSPSQMVEDVKAYLGSYDPETVRSQPPTGGDYPLELGAVRECKILYAGHEIAPKTGYFHVHILLSLTCIRFGRMQLKLAYNKLQADLRKICDVAYFHADAVKTPFNGDPLATERDERRLKAYIEKSMNFFSESEATEAAQKIITSSDRNRKQPRR